MINDTSLIKRMALVVIPAVVLFIMSIAIIYSSKAEAASTCRLVIDSSHTNNAIRDYCNSRADTTSPDPEAEQGELGWIPMFFTNPDQCDLGLAFPDLIPDFGIDISKINSCEILKAVSANAVNQVNEKFSEIEKDIDDTVGDGTIEIDPGDYTGGGGTP